MSGGPDAAHLRRDTNKCTMPPSLSCEPNQYLVTTVQPRRPLHRGEFHVALICALPKESRTLAAVFDGQWGDYGKRRSDDNSYKTGWIGRHNVVLAYMPSMGKVAASSVAAHLKSSFPAIRICLLVGICGGVPTRTENGVIRLGDVLISTGIKQYDFGRLYPDGLKRKDTLDDNLSRPNAEIRAFLHQLQASKDVERLTNQNLHRWQEIHHLKRPSADTDRLHAPGYRHKHQNPAACQICAACRSPGDPVCDLALESNCAELGCERTILRKRTAQQRDDDNESQLAIHFGYFASGDSVLESGLDRDRIASKEVIGFEMEGAGVWDMLPTVIVKGVCDYADSHKNKIWQGYAAAASASCTHALLQYWSFTDELQQPGASLTNERTEDEQSKHHPPCLSFKPMMFKLIIRMPTVTGFPRNDPATRQTARRGLWNARLARNAPYLHKLARSASGATMDQGQAWRWEINFAQLCARSNRPDGTGSSVFLL